MSIRTRKRMEAMVYKMRDSFGDKDPLKCGITGPGWNSKKHDNFVDKCMTLRRLAFRHHKLAEMDCNGEGVIRGQHYYNGHIDDYARRTYGYGMKSAYITDGDTTVFDLESDKVQDKIEGICKAIGLRVEFQGDPRGYTCKFFKGDMFLDIQG